ncbi:antibiotic biosynthesis monooxygenase family protein [Actinomadura sp. 9N407]|uniref:antibiotic biosynthesis monooxygenase family protein n=1 Tax=Actinomadura sp. 9N407 TaxID=3375154 RepID=UPI0037BD3236
MTFRVLLRMQIRPGMGEEFEKSWHELGGTVTGNPANLGHCLARSTEDDDVYFIVSDWLDEPRFREYEHSREHVVHRERLHPFRLGGSMETMRMVYDVEGAAKR